MKLSDEQILFYLTGKASPEVKRHCDELRMDPNSTVSRAAEELRQLQAQQISLDLGKLISDEIAENQAVPPTHRWLPILGVFALVAFACFFAIHGYTSGAAARENVTRVQAENSGLKSQNASLRPAKELLDLAKPSDGPLHTVTFLPGDVDKPADIPDSVKLKVQNAVFPCRLKWSTDKSQGEVEVPLKGLDTKMPSGTLRIWCEPFYGQAWYQPFSIVHGSDYLGGTLGPTVLKMKPGDELIIHLDQPYAPWNAVMVRVKGRLTMVTLVRPGTQRDLKKYLAGEWKGNNEELPNTMLFWAKYGSKGLAQELAQYFVDHRMTKEKGGNYRGRMQTAFVVPFDDDGVAMELRSVTVDELVPILTEAFEGLRKQRPPQGPSIEADLENAKEILKSLKAIP